MTVDVGNSPPPTAVSGGGLVTVKPNIVFGKAGGKIVRAGDSIGAGNGGAQYSLFEGLKAAVKSRLKSANLTQPTYTTNRSASGATLHDIWVTGLAQLKTDLGADGGEIWSNGSINDVLQTAGNDAAGPWTEAQAVGFLVAGITSVIALYPATRFLIFGPAFAGGERWALNSSTGKPQGSGNTYDAAVRSMDAALARACAGFPSNVRYVSVYDAVFAAAALANPTSASSLFMTHDGLHPSLLGLSAITDEALASVLLAEYRAPGTIVSPSRADLRGGDWYDETRTFLQRHLTASTGSLPHPGVFNRFQDVNLHALVQLGLPASVTDAGVEGGALKFAQAGTQMLTAQIYAAPKTGAWGFAIQASLSTIAASMTALFGISNAGGTEAFLVGIDQATHATRYVRYETHASVTTKTAASAGAADALDHTWYFIHQPTEQGNDIIDVYCDQTQVFHINPGANFPTTGVGLAAALNTNSGFSIIKRAIYAFVE